MPGFNQTGPLGQDPMTGRKMGRCTNFGKIFKKQTTETKENINENLVEIFQGRGFGFGRGLGRGRGGKGFGMGRQNRLRGGN